MKGHQHDFVLQRDLEMQCHVRICSPNPIVTVFLLVYNFDPNEPDVRELKFVFEKRNHHISVSCSNMKQLKK